METVGLMERFADPLEFFALSQGERLTGVLVTTGLGMGMTFLILLLLWGIIAGISKVFCRRNVSAQKAVELECLEEETVLLAAAVAAVCAYEAETTASEAERYENDKSGERDKINKIKKTRRLWRDQDNLEFCTRQTVLTVKQGREGGIQTGERQREVDISESISRYD